MTSFKRILGVVLAAVLLITFVPIQNSEATSLSDYEQQLEALQKRQKEIDNYLLENKGTVSDARTKSSMFQEQIQNIQSQIDLLINDIEIMEGEIAELNEKIEQREKNIVQKEKDLKILEADLKVKEKNIESTYDQFKARVRAMYMTGNASSLTMLLNSTDFADYLYRSELVKRMSAHDQDLVEQIRTEMKAIENTKQEINKAIETIDAEIITLQKDKDEVNINLTKTKETQNEQSKAQHALGRALAEQQNFLMEYGLIEAEHAHNEQLMAEMETEIQRIIAESGNKPPGHYFEGTSFTWPLPGFNRPSNITTTFNEAGSYWSSGYHKGVDIAGRSTSGASCYGETIVAAMDGVVIATYSGTGYNGGYGKYVIIDHGLDTSTNTRYTTLYAHCSAVLVSPGQSVAAGQSIARVGDTGLVTGPHLHFEVRIDGTPVDPMQYF